MGGWLPRTGTRSAVAGSVLAGAPGAGGLDHLGSVGSGLADAEARDLTARLRGLERPDSPFAAPGADRHRTAGLSETKRNTRRLASLPYRR
jgi:ATP-dependent DNA ligase